MSKVTLINANDEVVTEVDTTDMTQTEADFQASVLAGMLETGGRLVAVDDKGKEKDIPANPAVVAAQTAPELPVIVHPDVTDPFVLSALPDGPVLIVGPDDDRAGSGRALDALPENQRAMIDSQAERVITYVTTPEEAERVALLEAHDA